jgi:hypothetical protein
VIGLNLESGLGIVAHAYSPSYLGGGDGEVLSLKSAPAKS